MRHQFLIGAFVTCLSGLLTAEHSGQQRGAATQSARLPIPYEVDGGCPFETCVYQEWTAKARVDVRSGRRPSDSIVFSLRPGDRIQAVTGVLATIKPGRVQFKAPMDLESGAGPVHVQPGETLYILDYHGEGEATAWFKGRKYDRLDGAEFFDARCEKALSACNGSILEWPQRVWWVQLRSASGVIGWTRETEKFDRRAAND
jgi:hypothetical protein